MISKRKTNNKEEGGEEDSISNDWQPRIREINEGVINFPWVRVEFQTDVGGLCCFTE